MKRDQKKTPWIRLAEAARKQPPEASVEVPTGFSTRVAAQGLSEMKGGLAVALDRFSWRALAAAVVVMLLCLTSFYSGNSTNSASSEDETLLLDPISEYIEYSSAQS